MKLSSEKHWQKDEIIQKISNTESGILYWNDSYYLSVSRALLIKKAREIKENWIKNLQKQIDIIETIEIK